MLLLGQRIGYEFSDPALLEQALTHRSYEHDRPRTQSFRARSLAVKNDNEQMEFLGDSVLGFAVSEALFRAHPALSEGQLSQRKAHLVSAVHLHDCALRLGLGVFLRLGRGEERNGGRERRTLLANAMEALIAAIYLDGGLEPARGFIHRHVLGDRHTVDEIDSMELLNFKSTLQEQAQARGLQTPRYSIVETSGPEHEKIFTVEVRVGSSYAARAMGSTKKAASQMAAKVLAEELQASNWSIPSGPLGEADSEPVQPNS